MRLAHIHTPVSLYRLSAIQPTLLPCYATARCMTWQLNTTGTTIETHIMKQNHQHKKSKVTRSSKTPSRQRPAIDLPTSRRHLGNLFAYLLRKRAPECDQTLGDTIAFLKKRKLAVKPIVLWLQQEGGYCDCEVRLNVIPRFDEMLDQDDKSITQHPATTRAAHKQTVLNTPSGRVSRTPAPTSYQSSPSESRT